MRVSRSAIGVAGALLLALAPGGARGVAPPPAKPPPPPPPEALRLINDAALTVRARRQVNAEPALAALNLGIRVQRGVAEVWGPLSAADLPARVNTELLKVEGITEVKCRLYPAAPRRDAVTRSNGPPPLPVVVVQAAKPLAQTKEVPTEKSVRPVKRTEGDLVSRAVPPPPPLPDKEAALREAIARLQQSQPAFREAQVTLSGGKVLIRPAPGDAASATDLAEKLRDVPGIGPVVLLSE